MKHNEQLSHQIKETLSLALPATLDLEIVDVICNGSSHFIAIFKPLIENYDYEAGYEALEDAKENLLDEIADSINRRRVPNISFKISKGMSFLEDDV
jgi:ribosome-binding factor A